MTVITTIEDGVAVVTLDDGKMNAVSHDVVDGLHAALDTALAEAGAVCIRGNGRALSAGFDLKVMGGGDLDAVVKLVNAGGELLMRLFVHPQPTVVAVNGHALAAGALLVLACDTRIASSGAAKIGLNETAIGMALPEFAYELAAARLSKRYLTRAAVQAEIFDPDGAVAAGYLDRLEDDCVAAAMAEARALAQLPVAAYAGTKRSLRQPMVDRVLANLTR
ncbi:MAG TPA: crotonase/enoyl-CoA hydratase family protein [Acidimicrobiales bacterium]|nr:crotonase/enoyl-CoA hydratase family protein [Acidimicrobiales bacterium]